MRIDANQKLRDLGEVGAAESSNARPQTNAAGKSSFSEDVAELSPDRVRVQSLVSQANQAPEVRQEKVTALGLAIRQGNYNVTPEETAAAMLEDFRPAA
jgi:flagellar biosynthesis anti-sigma factor FlgM